MMPGDPDDVTIPEEETARERLIRLLDLPYDELEAAIADGTFERARQASLRESRAWRRVEE